MSAQFTPGPWGLITSYSGPTAPMDGDGREPGPFVRTGLRYRGVGYGYETIALLPDPEAYDVPEWFDYSHRGGTLEANANLIAAAPTLYEALERVCDTYGFDASTDSSIWQEAFAALAKARGETL